MSKKQDFTAMSSAEAEYVALSASCAQVMWMRTQLEDYGFNYNKIPLYCETKEVDIIKKTENQAKMTKLSMEWKRLLLKRTLTESSYLLVVPDWNLPFELMCDASDFAIGAVLGQRKMKHFQPIHYASKTMTEAQIHYTTTEKEMLAVVYCFWKSSRSLLSYPKA
ncbi:reverse transcriptase domain-containing protein [Tanacetum coccineum]